VRGAGGADQGEVERDEEEWFFYKESLPMLAIIRKLNERPRKCK
jgi:hypothetical protein